MVRAVIFDRDGVLIEDVGFPHREIDLRWTAGALDLLSWLKGRGTLALVATNQSGIARGYFPSETVEAFHALMSHQARAAGGGFDRILYCPHLPSGSVAPFNIVCDCRKPKPGMLRQLMDEFGLKNDEVMMVGDRQSDLGAAQAAGIPGYLFSGGRLDHFVKALLT